MERPTGHRLTCEHGTALPHAHRKHFGAKHLPVPGLWMSQSVCACGGRAGADRQARNLRTFDCLPERQPPRHLNGSATHADNAGGGRRAAGVRARCARRARAPRGMPSAARATLPDTSARAPLCPSSFAAEREMPGLPRHMSEQCFRGNPGRVCQRAEHPRTHVLQTSSLRESAYCVFSPNPPSSSPELKIHIHPSLAAFKRSSAPGHLLLHLEVATSAAAAKTISVTSAASSPHPPTLERLSHGRPHSRRRGSFTHWRRLRFAHSAAG